MSTQTKVKIDLAQEYIALKKEEETIAQRKKEILAEVQSQMTRDGIDKLEFDHGYFKTFRRTSYHWTLDALKAVFGKKWTQYVKTDDTAVKHQMEGDKPELVTSAQISSSEITSFYER